MNWGRGFNPPTPDNSNPAYTSTHDDPFSIRCVSLDYFVTRSLFCIVCQLAYICCIFVVISASFAATAVPATEEIIATSQPATSRWRRAMTSVRQRQPDFMVMTSHTVSVQLSHYIGMSNKYVASCFRSDPFQVYGSVKTFSFRLTFDGC